jgi:hypothetical protein
MERSAAVSPLGEKRQCGAVQAIISSLSSNRASSIWAAAAVMLEIA